MTIIFVSLFLLYIVLLIALISGWNSVVNKGTTVVNGSLDEQPLISIVIPARNEEQNIGALLGDLSKQRFRNLEVIVMDDHSEDRTAAIVEAHVLNDDRFFLLPCLRVGKKEALTQGIGAAKGTIIVTTDADCRVTENWIAGLVTSFTDVKVKMVFGAVKMNGATLFSRLQSMEFVSLIGSAAATAELGATTMCNGANLGFRKSVFYEVGGYSDSIHIPSGDDEFLLRKIVQRYPSGIKFSADPQTVVKTASNKDLKHLINQRIRWAGKWKLGSSFHSKALAAFIYSFQLAVVFLLPAILMQWIHPLAGLLLWLAKIVLEFSFLRRVSGFLNIPWSWQSFIILQFIYPFYVVIIGLLSNFRSFEWKGRKLKSLMVSSN